EGDDEDHSAFLAGPAEEQVGAAHDTDPEPPAVGQAEDLADQAAGDDFMPFSQYDLGLDDEAAEPPGGPPFSLSDLGLDDQSWSVEAQTSEHRETAADASLEGVGQSEHVEPADSGKAEDAPAVQPTHDADAQPIAEAARTEGQAGEAEPEIEPFSFAGLGLSDEELSDTEPAEKVDVTVAEASAFSELPPFSFADLGLSEADFADLDLGEPDGANASIPDVAQVNGAQLPAATGSQASSADQGAMRPFSLADLGLTDEELAELGFDPEMLQSDDLALDSGTTVAPTNDEDLPPFAFAVPELTDEELELFGLADQQAYASPPASPTPAPAPSAEADQGATGGEPDRQEATHEPPPVEADTTQKLLAFDDFDLGAYEQVAFEESHTLPAGAQSTQTPAPAAAPVSADLREIYAQLEVQPDNHALRLAVARLSEQKGDIERALEQYRQLIKRNALLDPVIEDLQDLAGGEYDHALLRRVHRLLGDAYIKQDRLQEALAQYSWI
ncbi:MAG TPA: hypothetical protein VE268_06565, partial [Herpetosiphonaceae bacterium]|nr:hypothetical protein [Herpetosiphonaceae bacterium]